MDSEHACFHGEYTGFETDIKLMPPDLNDAH